MATQCGPNTLGVEVLMQVFERIEEDHRTEYKRHDPSNGQQTVTRDFKLENEKRDGEDYEREPRQVDRQYTHRHEKEKQRHRADHPGHDKPRAFELHADTGDGDDEQQKHHLRIREEIEHSLFPVHLERKH